MNWIIPQFPTNFKNALPFLLLIAAILIAAFQYKEYGISWDEPTQRETGLVNYNYIFNDDDALLKWKDRDYGAAVELPLIVVEKIFGLSDSKTIYSLRHLITHLFFLLGAFFCFKLVDLIYKNKWLATIAFLMIVLHPRIYAHSFFNSKDIPFMAMFIICLYLTAKAFHKKKWQNFLVLGICLGLLIDMRIMGIILLCCVLGYLVIDAIKEKKYKAHLMYASLLLLGACTFTYLFWPYLWASPIENFITAFENMSKFRWDSSVLFGGEFLKSVKLPWYYIPAWFSITTPLIYIVLGALSTVLIFVQIIKKRISILFSFVSRMNLLFLFCFYAPVVLVIAIQSVLYDGWRQMFFIYPSFVLLAIYGIYRITTIDKFKYPVYALVGVTFLMMISFMVSNFPFQHVYFNRLVKSTPEHRRKNYEQDYWGTSFKQSLEYILAHDNSNRIKVYPEISPGKYNVLMLPEKDRERIDLVSREEANYIITNYRWRPYDYTELKDYKYHQFLVANSTVSEIFYRPDTRLP